MKEVGEPLEQVEQRQKSVVVVVVALGSEGGAGGAGSGPPPGGEGDADMQAQREGAPAGHARAERCVRAAARTLVVAGFCGSEKKGFELGFEASEKAGHAAVPVKMHA